MQLTALLLDYNFSLEKAFNLPRIDANESEIVFADPEIGEDILNNLEKKFSLKIAQNLVFPKLYGSPSGVYRNSELGMTYGCSDKTSPVAGAVAEEEFIINSTPMENFISLRA